MAEQTTRRGGGRRKQTDQVQNGRDPEATDAEEKIRREQDERAAAKAAQEANALKEAIDQVPVGGTRATKVLLQVTGGAVEIPAEKCPQKDSTLRVMVTGWVKTIKHVSAEQGGPTHREAVLVVDGLQIQSEELRPEQLQMDVEASA